MNPHSIFLRNVRTFDEILLDFPVGLLAIIGQNGAGKSTLISAVDVALFGPEGRSLAPWYPRGGGVDELTIELVFDHAGQLYRVRRSFSPKGRGMSKCDFERAISGFAPKDRDAHDLAGVWEPLTLESQTETQALIEQTIGLSRATFRASSYLAQGDAGAFCDAAPRDRKAILSEVVGLADWDRYLERARAEKRAGELELAETRALLERADEELAKREAVETDRAAAEQQEREHRAGLEVTTLALVKAREQLTEANKQVERRAAAERAHRDAYAAVVDLLARLSEQERKIAALDARLAVRDELAAQAGLLPELQTELAALQEAVGLWQERERLVGEADELRSLAVEFAEQAGSMDRAATNVLKGVDEEHCDRCGQVLGRDAAERASLSYHADAENLRKKGNAAADELAGRLTRIDALPAEQPDSTRLAALYTEIRQAQESSVRLAALDEAAVHKASAADELGVMRAELPSREGAAAGALADVEALGPHDPAELDRAQAEVDRLAWTEQETRGAIEQAVTRLATANARIERLDAVAAQMASAVIRRDTILEALELQVGMERACGANGIPALILESVAIPQVEAEASRLLRILGGPATSVELRTQRENKGGGISDTLDIVLSTDTGEAPYESFSGGERARIAFALRLALAQLLSGRKGADTGLLVIDEIDGLDAQGIAALVTVLEEMQRAVPRIIVVSHDAELRDAFPQSLVLENADGRSRVLEAAVV